MNGMMDKAVTYRGLVYLPRLGVGNAKRTVSAVAINEIRQVDMQANDIIHQAIFKFSNIRF